MDDALSIINDIENIVEEASKMPFSDKVMVEREEMLDLITNLRLVLPDELKSASHINDNRERILAQAQREADLIIKEAEEQIEAMVDEAQITREARLRAEEIVTRSQENAKEIRLGSLEYADNVLEDIEDELKDIIKTIRENRNELTGE